MKISKRCFLVGGFLVVSFLAGFLGRKFYLRIAKRWPTLDEKELAQLTLVSPASLVSPTLSVSPLATIFPSPISLKPVGSSALLPLIPHTYQTFNNCGPANLSMILGFYGVKTNQQEIADEIRPYQHPKGKNDDKTMFLEEFANYVVGFDLSSVVRVAGSIDIVKQFLANGLPVVTKQLLHLGEDPGHYRIVRGFDEENQVLVCDDSYDGPNRKISYDSFLKLWQPFNYAYIVVFPPSEKFTVEAILEEIDPKLSHRKAVERALKEIEKDPENIYPYFNLSTSYYHLDDYAKTVEFFEKVEERLPDKMLWYQIEPILAYQKLGDFERVFKLTEKVFASGNPAFSELYQVRGEIYLSQNEKEKARAEFEKAILYNKNYQPAQEALSNLKT
jgi:hypothetical protein